MQDQSYMEDSNLRIDLGLKLQELLPEAEAEQIGSILDLLALESASSYLAPSDYARMRIKLSELVEMAYQYGRAAREDHEAERVLWSQFYVGAQRMAGELKGFAHAQ